MVPGSEPGGAGRGMLSLLPHHPQPAAARRSRNAGADVCELELMEIDRMFRLHRFTGVRSPGTGG